MENLNRTAKPVPLWISYDLHAFNIEIIDERDFQTFFGLSDLPVPQNISPVIWNNVRAPAGQLSKTEKTFFAYMEDALRTPPGEWSLVDDFALFLLELFNYDDGPSRILQSQEALWLPICGSKVLAKTDAAVIERVGHQPYCILLVQEDTHLYDNGGCDPEAQLVAQAIAAFHRNSRARNLIGLPALDAQTFPAIIMFCTAPVFYFVTITKALADAVQAGVYPQEATIVRKFLSPMGATADSMLSLENRRALFGYFEAFKRFLPPAIENPSAQYNKSTVFVDSGNFDKTRNQWLNDIAAGTRKQLSLVKENDQEAWSNVITVDESNDDPCLSSTGTASASSSAVALTRARSTFPPGALWTARNLEAFNITITAEHDIQTFFGVSELPVPQNISPVIWNNVRAPDGLLSKTEKMFFAFMENALLTPIAQGSHAVDFIRFMLRLLDYDDDPNRVLHSRKDIWFIVSGLKTFVKTDVAVIERFGRKLYYNLLVQENTCRYITEGCDPEAQLVAQAVAAFHRNNRLLSQVCRPELDSQTFPGIIMTYTTPTFYLITVTKALSVAVEAGICPRETTVVRKFLPPVESANHIENAMLSLQNRQVLFGCFAAFKRSLPPGINAT
ncbi:hypothetical protein D9619_004831 [Psilocybe cf. subviscida]|uniref:Uncharacterized protein n=1 Tax=Psilocybe cf. subviscida TaxID=2480587 RepID=A0A8H5BP18_9AGAR|nr:hypothetical protein D9619_004831 [Psilocybe cf. subviscida]